MITTPSDKKLTKLLLTHKQMAQVYRNGTEEDFSPYFFKISSDNQYLYFVGARHTNDPSDYQIPKILNLWKEFLNKTTKQNSIVLVEGGGAPVEMSVEDAIKKYNGSGLPVYLANLEKIKYYSPEPDEKMEIQYLLNFFTREEILNSRFASLIYQWHRFLEKPDFEKYMYKYLNRYQKIALWNDIEFTINYVKEVHNHMHNHPFDLENIECFIKDSNPSENQVSSLSNIFRDIYIVKEIIRQWNEGKSIFIVYGSGHAIVQEPALKKLLKI